VAMVREIFDLPEPSEQAGIGEEENKGKPSRE